MSGQLTRDEREALIVEHAVAGDEGSVDAAWLEDASVLTDLLAEPSTWIEPPADLEDRVVAAVERIPRRVHLARRNRRRLVGSAGVATVMMALAVFFFAHGSGSSQTFAADLRAPAATSRAAAAVRVTENEAGYRVVLDGAGLVRLDEKRQYYEAWMTNSDGTAVPIGTFTSCDDPITMWSGASPETFTRMTVTLEDTDNDQASSGRVVLAGALRSS